MYKISVDNPIRSSLNSVYYKNKDGRKTFPVNVSFFRPRSPAGAAPMTRAA